MKPATVAAASLGAAEHRAATQRAAEWKDCLWMMLPSAGGLWKGSVREFSS